MAHLLFDPLNGVSLDNQTVQSLLDSQTLPSDVSPESNLASGGATTITLDEEDVFQCGKCKKQFTSFSLFMCHKKEHTAATPTKISVSVEGDKGQSTGSQDSASTDTTSYQQIQVQALDSTISTSDLGQPIILSDADILSFNIDQNTLSITSAVQTSLPNVMQGNSYLTSTADSTCLKPLENNETASLNDSFNVATLSGQSIILTSQLPQGSYIPSSLPSIQSLTSQSKVGKSQNVASVKKDNMQNISILSNYPNKCFKGCKVLLPNVDYTDTNIGERTLLLECESSMKTSDKTLQYENDTNDAVLLDYSDGTADKCKVLLSNGEYAETSIEYIDTSAEEGIVEYSRIGNGSEENNTVMNGGAVTVSLLDVVEPSDGQTVTLDLAKDVDGSVDTQSIPVTTDCLSIAIPDTSSTSTIVPNCVQMASHATTVNHSNPPNITSTESKETAWLSGTKTLKLKCQYCNKMFSKNFDLQQHMRSHTGEKPFQCVVCGRAFSQKSNVKKHMATHKVWPNGLSRTLPKEPLQIVNSPVKTKEIAAEKETKEITKVNEESNTILIIDRSYVCQYCSMSFSSYFELKTHMKNHSHQKVYKCIQKNCQKTFPDLDSFVEHTKMHTDEVQYCCHVCYRKFNTLADLGIHQYTHNTRSKNSTKSPRYFLCMKCKSKFTSSKALEHHLSTTNHHFPCSHCGKVFTCERYLRRHLPTHGAPESFICPTCGKGFRTEQYLNTHRLIHSGVKPYACMHCSAAFNRKDKLARHSLIHQSVKKFKCPFHNYLGCSKEFNRQDKLKMHILTHSVVKPYHCRKCNKMFLKQALLREHERIHHCSDAPFVCTSCGTRFRKKVHLSTHSCNSTESADEQLLQNVTPEVNSTPETPRGKTTHIRRTKKLRNTKQLLTSLKNNDRNRTLTSRGQAEPQGENEIDNVPTIEIIVMPMPCDQRQEGNEQGKSVYHVMFPENPNAKELPEIISSSFNNATCSSSCLTNESKNHTNNLDSNLGEVIIGI